MENMIYFLLFCLWSVSGGNILVMAQQEVVYNSEYEGDALVHSAVKPGNTNPPFIFIPGLNLASYIFCTTPDGRKGWVDLFVEAGHDVYVINDPDFDFAKDPAGVVSPPWTVPDKGPPAQTDSSQRWQRDIWQRWGFGESEGNPYPDARFPTDYFDVFAANYPFVGSSFTGQSFASAIESLILRLNTTVILAPHSAGGPPAVEAAKNQLSLVQGFVFLEIIRPPDESDFPALSGSNVFAPYGDYIESRRQTGRKEGVEAAAALFAAKGGMADVVSLPDDLGVFGNSHLFMQDNNNDFIAELILTSVRAWMTTATNSPVPILSPTNVPTEVTIFPSVEPTAPAPNDGTMTSSPTNIPTNVNSSQSPESQPTPTDQPRVAPSHGPESESTSASERPSDAPSNSPEKLEPSNETETAAPNAAPVSNQDTSATLPLQNLLVRAVSTLLCIRLAGETLV